MLNEDLPIGTKKYLPNTHKYQWIIFRNHRILLMCSFTFLTSNGEYDGGIFESYPERRGYSSAELLDPEFWSWTPEQHKLRAIYLDRNNQSVSTDMEEAEVKISRFSFLQTWLYFGMLKSVLGSCVSSCDFIQENDSGASSHITTSCLPACIEKWIHHQRRSGKKARRTERKRDFTSPAHIRDQIGFLIFILGKEEDMLLVTRGPKVTVGIQRVTTLGD